MEHVIDYMDHRTSSKVTFIKDFPDNDITVKINASLFEWVIENLCKNAVDAMEGSGTITLAMARTADKVAIEVSDTGKGIRKKTLETYSSRASQRRNGAGDWDCHLPNE